MEEILLEIINNKKKIKAIKNEMLNEFFKRAFPNSKKKAYFAFLDGKLINYYDEIKSGKKIEFIFDLNHPEVINLINNFIIDELFGILKNSYFASKIIERNVKENIFSFDFVVKENLSKTILESLVQTLNKQLSSKVKTSTLAKLVSFIFLFDISGIQIENDNQIANRIMGFASVDEEHFLEIKKTFTDREERDHRRIGRDLDLFFIDDTIGKGLPIWYPNGVKLKRKIQEYIYNQEQKYGFLAVETPELGSIELYKTSGHYKMYKENMFPEMKISENEIFVLRPMACPHHIIIYKSKSRSYKQLPLRFSENVNQFRFESSGSLLGLERVRAMELTDSHIFLREDQLEDEIKLVLKLIKETLASFDIKIEFIELALRDPKNIKKYHGEKDKWDKAEKILKNFLNKNKIDFIEKAGEAAFYGPKIDIQIKTALGHIITLSTIQLDFFLPEKFELEYIDKENKSQRPIMIHRGLIGTYERFIAVLLEQTKGNLPFWLAPNQIVILPINNKLHLKYATEILNKLKEHNFNVLLDDSDERLGSKIRKYQLQKYNYQVMIGDSEIKAKNLSYRMYGEEKTTSLKFDDFIKKLK